MQQSDSLMARTDGVGLSHVATDSLSAGRDSVVFQGFSPWQIALQMGNCTPQQLDSAIQANLPVREKIRSERPDTLCIPGLKGEKPYEAQEGHIIDFSQGFFHSKPMFHPELSYRSQGMSATPVPYMLWRDDLVTGSLLVCLILLVRSFNNIRHKLHQQAKDFFFAPREKSSLFAVETSIELHSRSILILQLCLMGGLFMFAYAQYQFNFFLGQLSPRWLLGIYVSSFIGFFIVKRILNGFVNWIFFPKSQQKLWKDCYTFLISSESIVFFPLLLIFIYFRIPFEKAALIFVFILLIFKILLAFKTYHIFFPKSYCLFHLFTYLCALELMPLLALWKSLAIVTESLIVKY